MNEKELRDKTSMMALSLLTYILILLLVLVGLYFVLHEVKIFYFNSLSSEGVVYGFYANNPIYTIVSSLFLSPVLAVYITKQFYKRRSLHHKANDLVELQNKFNKMSWDFSGNKKTIAVLLIVSFSFELFSFNYYYIFNSRSVVYSPFLSVKKESIKYEDIGQIIEYNQIKAPNGKIIKKYVFKVVGKDGKGFSSFDSLIPESSLQKIVQFLEEKSLQKRSDGGLYIRSLRDLGS